MPGSNTQNLGQLNAFNANQAQQQNKTQIFQSRSNSQQHIQANLNPALKTKNKIKQNQQLEGQISGLGSNGSALNKRATQKAQYDYDLTYHDTNSSALGLHTNPGRTYSKKTSSGSMPLKYGSETRAQQDPKHQMLSQVMPIFGSRNNHNQSNTNPQNQTLYTNISLREISQSPDAAGRRDENAADPRVQQQRKQANNNKRGKKIQITSGKHGGIINLQNANLINNGQKQLSRTGGAASALAGNMNGAGASGNMLQMNTQTPVDLNMSNLSHNVPEP